MKNKLELFENISKIYTSRLQKPLWQRYPNCLKDSLDALCIFLEEYAFERQGRNPSYAHAAVEAVRNAKDRPIKPEDIWNDFRRLMNYNSLNAKNNPLYHVQEDQANCKCILCVLGRANEIENIIKDANVAIKNGNIRERWNRIKEIRGVGDKISSLFLRDIALAGHLPLAQANDRELLQPVDIWVRRTVSFLDPKMTDEHNAIKRPNMDFANWIVNDATDPERFNQGAWYFGAQIAGSEFRLRKACSDINYATELVSKHIESLQSVCEAYKDDKCPL